eukprot:COSAG02_NODE_737_length_17855_cov_18.729049_2_plen_165_part_00
MFNGWHIFKDIGLPELVLRFDSDCLQETTTAHNLGSLLELQLNCSGRPVQGSSTDIIGMHVLGTSDRESYTVVGYNYTSSRLFVDHRRSSRHVNSTVVQTAPLHIGTSLNEDQERYKEALKPLASTSSANFLVELVSLVDYALLESFVNRRAVLSSWVCVHKSL